MAFNECWDRGSHETDKKEELLVFGYSCKLFRDDEKALHIDRGKHLIPWMNDDNLMIDRYDARLHLYNVADLETQGETHVLLKSEQEEEEALDQERYYDLNKDLEVETYQEEELKRLRAAVALDGAYHETPFNYDQENGEATKVPTSQNLELPKEPEEEDVAFTAPEGLVCQPNMVLPGTMKEFAIIEKTAQFVSQQGGQMEIYIKMKQGNNPQFGFLGFEDPLNPFYKWLVAELKSGRYKPRPLALPREESEEEEDSEDDHYLHPSLFAAKTSPIKIPTLAFKGSGEDAYSQLVKNLQNLVSTDSRGSSPRNLALEDSAAAAPPPPPGLEPVQLPNTTVSPPPDIQAIIEKMAVYASKNGDDFETIVKSKEDKRFDFLHPWNQFHQYYMTRKKHYCTDQDKPSPKTPPAQTTKPAKPTGPPAPVSFSLKPKEDGSQPKASLLLEPDSETEATPQVTDESLSPKEPESLRKQEARLIADKLKDKLAAAARDRLHARKVQMERRRKAVLFLDQLNKLNGTAAAPSPPLTAEPADPEASQSPSKKRSVSPAKRRSHSPAAKKRIRSPSANKKRSRSPSATKKSRASSANKKRSRSPSATKRSRSPSSNKKSRSPSVNKKSRSPSANKKSRSPSANKKSRSPSANKKSRSPSVNKKSRSPSANKKSRSPSANKKSRSPSANKRSRSPSANKRSSSPAAKRRSRSPAAKKRSSSPATAKKRSSSPAAVKKRSRSPTVTKKKSSSPPAAKKRCSSPAKKRRRSSSSSSSSSSGSSRSHSRSRHHKSSRKHSKKHSKKKKKKHRRRHHSTSRHRSKSNHRAKTPPAAYLLVRRSRSPSRHKVRERTYHHHRESSRRHRR